MSDINSQFEAALEELGGVQFLVDLGRKNPGLFASLTSKMLTRRTEGESKTTVAWALPPHNLEKK